MSIDKLTPSAVVAELDRYIIGQKDAKRAVAVALRNRWRRQQLDSALRDEVTPKNILMIGPTGCGKTEISRRLAKLAQAPFVKVEATKFTEVRSEEHTSELQSLMRISYAVFCLKKKRNQIQKLFNINHIYKNTRPI